MGVDRVTQYGNLTGFQQGFLLAVFEDSRKEVKRRKVMQTAIKAVAFQFGNDTHFRIGAIWIDVVCSVLIVGAYLHIAVQVPNIIVEDTHTTQSGNGLGLAIGCNPPLHNLLDGVFCRLSDLAVHLCTEVTEYLVLLASGDNAEVFHFSEHSLSGIQHFQLLATMRTSTTANALRQMVLTLPLVSTLQTSDDTFLCSVCIVLETMFKCVCSLCL